MKVINQQSTKRVIKTAPGQTDLKCSIDAGKGLSFRVANIQGFRKRVGYLRERAARGWQDSREAGSGQAHSGQALVGMDMTLFDALVTLIVEELKALGVPSANIAEIMPVFDGARSEALNR